MDISVRIKHQMTYSVCYFGCFFDLLINLILSISRAKGPYMYNLPYAYAYALSDMRRITLVLMHILIQPPSSYKSSFSYKTSDDAETHDPSTHATQSVEILIARSLYILNYRNNLVILYTAFRVCLVRMHAHSAGISS